MNPRKRRLAKQRRLRARRTAEEYWRWKWLVLDSFTISPWSS